MNLFLNCTVDTGNITQVLVFFLLDYSPAVVITTNRHILSRV